MRKWGVVLTVLYLVLSVSGEELSSSGLAQNIKNDRNQLPSAPGVALAPTTRYIQLPGDVRIDLVLVRSGEFIQGVPEPILPDFSSENRAIFYCLPTCVISAIILFLTVAIGLRRRHWKIRFSLFEATLGVLFVGAIMYFFFVVKGAYSAIHQKEQAYELEKSRFSEASKCEKPARKVIIPYSFYVGKYEITREQYAALMDFSVPLELARYPQDKVSWDEAQDFCARLSRITHEIVRLPYESEWEYACRAGTNTRYNLGDSVSDLNDAGWYGWNVSQGPWGTRVVGQKKPNAFGLFDMHGNVGEWCADWFDKNWYSSDIFCRIGPLAPSGQQMRVFRGGGWNFGPGECRSCFRGGVTPLSKGSNVGFRIVVELPPKPVTDRPAPSSDPK